MRRMALVLGLLGGLIFAGVDALFLAGEHHGEFWWSHVYGFFSVFGFVGGMAIILVAKLLLGPGLQRKENYYDEWTSP